MWSGLGQSMQEVFLQAFPANRQPYSDTSSRQPLWSHQPVITFFRARDPPAATTDTLGTKRQRRSKVLVKDCKHITSTPLAVTIAVFMSRFAFLTAQPSFAVPALIANSEPMHVSGSVFSCRELYLSYLFVSMCCILPVGPHSVDSVDSVRDWVLEQRQHARYMRLGMAILGVCGHTAR